MQKKPSPAEKICLATLKCAAQKPWQDMTMAQIAKTAKMPIKSLEKIYADKYAIIPAIAAMFDAMMPTQSKKPNNTPWNDAVFENLMARFDILQNHRKGILSIAEAVKHDKKLSLVLARGHWNTMHKIAEHINLEKTFGKKHGREKKFLATGILLGIYYYAFYNWCRDESADMTKTMASLDKAMRMAGKLNQMK